MEVKMSKKISKRTQIGKRNFTNFNLRYKDIYKNKNKNFNNSIEIKKFKAWKIKKFFVSKSTKKKEKIFGKLKLTFGNSVVCLVI